MELSPSDLRIFAAVADTLLPALAGEGTLWTSSASDLGIPARFPGLFARLPDDKARADLRRLLRLLDTRAGGLLLYGKLRRFTSLSPVEAEAALRKMAGSQLPQARQGFQVLKRLTGLLVVTAPEGESSSAIWPDLTYPGPLGPPPVIPKTITPVQVTAPAEWSADVVVVGSGAGGGPAAAVLAGAGLDVVVLEKGRYLNEADFTHLEAEAYRDLYLDGNLAATEDLGIAMIAGSCLGGGTIVNYTTSFATPPEVRDEWDRVAGFHEVFTGEDYEASSKVVEARLGVNSAHNTPSTRDALMEAGLKARGWHVAAMPRNVSGCPQDEACGFCTMGCRRQAKRSALRTWLEDASRAGARIVVEAEVSKVLIDAGRAAGVEASVRGAPLTVRARAVVLACGSLHTPALLRRSGAGGPATGKFLRLHPVTAMWGRFPDKQVRPWTGTVQALYSDQFADLDGRGYGCKFETAPVHPVLPASFFGWAGGRQFKQHLLEYPHWSLVGVLLRDRDPGRVKVRRDGRPVWHYRLSKRDQAHMRVGLLHAAEVLAEAGAEEVLGPTAVPVTWRPGSRESAESFMS
ncbi:MAG: GMC family oxidoreductase N-terminal domain-containing protein, partial [Candidatus Methylomirabilia bacterium]